MFLGRHLVEAAQARGHELTLFNRGRTAPQGLPGVEVIHGDREHDLAALGGRSWDAAIDTCGYLPRVVRSSAEFLSEAVEHYTFVSSISVYGTFPEPRVSEDTPVAPPPDPPSEDVGTHYGALKAGCEREVQAVFGAAALVVRPGLIVGPFDPTERFTYWVRRLGEGGRVLAPRAVQQPVQFIDARDLAEWMIRLSEAHVTGVFNATGPAEPLTLGGLLERMRVAVATHAELVWVGEAELAAAGVAPWDGLPLWLDLPRNPEFRGFLAADIGRALAAGLTFRPLETTVADTLRWVGKRTGIASGPAEFAPPPAGLSAEREAQLLAALDPA
jgi:2'-hydroxyisoflavone reductase